jgi:hypothetical protein
MSTGFDSNWKGLLSSCSCHVLTSHELRPLQVSTTSVHPCHTVNNLKRAPEVVIEECLEHYWGLEQNVALGGENIAAMAANIRHFPLAPQHGQNPLCLSIVSGSLTVQQKLA